MKTYTTITLAALTILALLFSFLPVSTALAKKDAVNVTLTVKNRTGGTVLVRLTDENGKSLFYAYEPGQTNTVLFEGHFRYYASTLCGNQSGVFNLNVTKELFFSCNAGLEMALLVPFREEICMPAMPEMSEHPAGHCHPMTHPE
jgi:hypothetical protein